MGGAGERRGVSRRGSKLDLVRNGKPRGGCFRARLEGPL